MRKFLISGALIAAAFTANPASAQYHRGYDNRFDHRIDRLAERVDRAYDRGQIDRRTARILMREVDRLVDLERSSLRDGRLTRNERYWINRRFESINNRLQGSRDYARYDRRYR